MKILIVSTTFSENEGGATGIAYQQAVGLNNLGHEVFVFSGTTGNDLGWQKKDGINIYKIKNKNYRYVTRSYLCLFNFKVQLEFKKVLREVRPEVVHFHNLYYNLPFSLLKLAKKTKVKVFFTAHDVMTFSQHKLTFFVDKKWDLKNIEQIDYKFPLLNQIKQDGKAFNPFRNFLIRYYLKYCDKIFAVSNELKKALNQNGINNVEVIHNGIDVVNWVPNNGDVEQIKNSLKLEGKKVILFAGRLSWAKGGEIMIDVLSSVVEDYPETVLLILGERNSFVDGLENDVSGSNLKDRVLFTGYIPRSVIKNYYDLADVVVVPSICFDSFPTVNLEAMACKKPIITTCFGGGREIVKDGETGFVINPLAKDIFIKRINFLFKKGDFVEKMGEDGFDITKCFFSEKNWLNKIILFYEQI